MTDPGEPDEQAELLLGLSPAERAAWLEARPHLAGEPLIAALKRRSDEWRYADPAAVADAIECALLVVQACPDNARAHALALRARGNYYLLVDHQAALQAYEQALALYRQSNSPLEMAAVLGNMLGSLAETGRFEEAQAAYEQARTLLQGMGAEALTYLQGIEQNYGWLLHTQGRYDEALEAHARSLELARQLGRSDYEAEVRVNWTVTLSMLGRLRDVETTLLEERSVAASHDHDLTVARIDLNLGELYAALGRPAQALERFMLSRSVFERLGNQMELATVLSYQGGLLEALGLLREARRSYTRAREQFSTLAMLPELGLNLLRLVSLCRREGEYGEAAQLLDQAEQLWRQLDHSGWLTTTLLERVELALARHDYPAALALLAQPVPSMDNPLIDQQRRLLLAEALALQLQAEAPAELSEQIEAAFQQVLAYAREHGAHWMERRALVGLGSLLLSVNPSQARALLEQAIALDSQVRLALSVEELKASFQSSALDLFPPLVRLALAQDEPLRALRYIWQAKGSALLDLLQATTARRSSAGEQAELDALRQQLAGYRLQAASAFEEGAEPLLEHKDPVIRELEQRLSELRRRRNQQAAGQNLDFLSDPALLLPGLGQGILVEYMRCGEQLLAVRAEASGRCQAIWLGDALDIADLLDELHLSLQNVVIQSPERRSLYHDQWLAEALPLLQHCYQLLVEPLGPLPDGAELLVSPCNPLYMLPFAALHDGERYLCERVELELTPSGLLLALPGAKARTSQPVIVAAAAGGRLSAVRDEAASIKAHFPESLALVDDPATLRYLTSQLGSPRWLHIAAHSQLRDDAPLFSALQLPDGLLSIEQCYDLALEGTALVVLSGCTTASGLESGGSLLAFQSAFFAAGARRVISSLWLVDDQSGALFMQAFYRQLAAGLEPAAALRAAQRQLIATPALAHPALWAPFICSRR